MSSKIIPIFIPHIGCPHDCSFCNQKKIAGEITDVTGSDVSNMIRHYLNTMPSEDCHKEVAFFGGSFTGLSKEKQEELLLPAWRAKEEGRIQDIRISTRPDYISAGILQHINQLGVSIIELGVQSTDPEVLLLNQRGHSREAVNKAVMLIRGFSFKLGLQMMVGLLGDTEATVINTARELVRLKPDFVRVYPTIVIKDTHLERLYLEGKYQPFSLKQAVDCCVEVLKLFREAEIPVIRMGLQSTEEIAFGKSIVAGPYHPAFRELVEAEIYRELIDQQLKPLAPKPGAIVRITCNLKECSKVAGLKQSNKIYLKEAYGLSKISIKSSDIVDKGRVLVEIVEK